MRIHLPIGVLSTDGGGFVLFLVVAGVLLGVGGALQYLHRRRLREALDRLVHRDPRLQRTVIPCGLRPDELAWWCRGLPDGDRNNGTEHGVEGPMQVELATELPDEVTVAAFRWWWEERRRRRNQQGMRRTTYVTRRMPAALIKLPVHVPHRVLITPESTLGRAGLTRGGHQLESSEFNRRFRVEARQDDVAVYLLDAGLQQLLLEAYQGRTIEIFGELMLLGGRPDHHDESLGRVIGELPAMRQDAHRLLQAIPAAYWRHVQAAS